MKVTAIERQQKNTARFSVFIDEQYRFSFSEAGLLRSKLYPGQELSAQQVEELEADARFDNFYTKTLNYLSIRPRSEWEIRTYLKLKKCPPLLQDEILNKLSENRLINDRNFAHAWVESRRLLKPISRRRLITELRAKRIDSETIEEVLADDQTDESTVLKELISVKRRQTRYQDDLKLMQYLARQGFSYGDIKDALSEND